MIRLEQLHARAGEFELRDVTVELTRGSWGMVIGPAGSGKTTLLETIAGIRKATRGRVVLRGDDVTRVPAERRRVGIVYQLGFLFPHLSVDANVRYGVSDRAYADEIAARFGAAALSHRPVHSLSGGERQMVALARALAPRPDILLLDEPFAALDARSRTRCRRELRLLQREQGVTVLQVTHDFDEAATLGDLVLLLEGGRLVQADVPAVLFRRPSTCAAAEFLGIENIYEGWVVTHDRGRSAGPETLTFDAGTFRLSARGSAAVGPAHAVVRGEDVLLSHDGSAHRGVGNVLEGTIVDVSLSGIVARITLDVQGSSLVSVLTTAAARELALDVGGRVVASIETTSVHVC